MIKIILFFLVGEELLSFIHKIINWMTFYECHTLFMSANNCNFFTNNCIFINEVNTFGFVNDFYIKENEIIMMELQKVKFSRIYFENLARIHWDLFLETKQENEELKKTNQLLLEVIERDKQLFESDKKWFKTKLMIGLTCYFIIKRVMDFIKKGI